MYNGGPNYELKNSEYTSGLMKGWVFKTQEELSEGTHVGFYIPKLLPLLDVTSGPADSDESVDKGIFANTVTVPTSVHTANWIKVKWNGYSNMSQPVIALGESAHIFCFNNDIKQPRYTENFNNEVRRKTDKVRYYVHSKTNDTDDDDCYYVELNSIDNKIQIHTSKVKDEAHSYDIIIDTAASTLEAKDDENNIIGIYTEEKRVKAINSTGSFFDIVDDCIHGHCDADFTIDCDNFKVSAKTGIDLNGKSTIKLETQQLTMKGQTISTDATSATFKATSTMIDSPMTQFSGIAHAVGKPMMALAFIAPA